MLLTSAPLSSLSPSCHTHTSSPAHSGAGSGRSSISGDAADTGAARCGDSAVAGGNLYRSLNSKSLITSNEAVINLINGSKEQELQSMQHTASYLISNVLIYHVHVYPEF